MIQDPLALAAVIAAVTALAFYVAGRFGWAARVGPTLLVIAFGAVLSNLDLVAARSPVYDTISGPITSLAIVWLLFAVDLRSLRAAGPRMLGAFGLAVLSTVVGGLAAFALVGAAFPDFGPELAGVFVGTYSGGGLNFVSVGRELGLPDALFSAATAADNVVTALWLAATLLLPLWLVRAGWPERGADSAPEGSDADPIAGETGLTVPGLAWLTALGLGVMLGAEQISKWVPAVPSIVWLTSLALLCAQLPVVRGLKGALGLGTFVLHLFFGVLGIGSRFSEILTVGVEVFWFAVVVVAVHGALLLVLTRLFRFDADTTVVASQAAVGGPSTAMALAVARGRDDLTLPAASAGLLGYALGTYAGLAIAALLG